MQQQQHGVFDISRVVRRSRGVDPHLNLSEDAPETLWKQFVRNKWKKLVKKAVPVHWLTVTADACKELVTRVTGVRILHLTPVSTKPTIAAQIISYLKDQPTWERFLEIGGVRWQHY